MNEVNESLCRGFIKTYGYVNGTDESNARDLLTDLLITIHNDGGDVAAELRMALGNASEELREVGLADNQADQLTAASAMLYGTTPGRPGY